VRGSSELALDSPRDSPKKTARRKPHRATRPQLVTRDQLDRAWCHAGSARLRARGWCIMNILQALDDPKVFGLHWRCWRYRRCAL